MENKNDQSRVEQGETIPPTGSTAPSNEDDPSVMGAGCGPSPVPLRSEAEAVWRKAYVDRMVERGIEREDAQACCDAGDADLEHDPAGAADDELSYWADDADVPADSTKDTK